MILCCGIAFAQSETANANNNDNNAIELRADAAMRIEHVLAIPSGEDCQYDHGRSTFFRKTPYYEGTTLNNPIEIKITKFNSVSIKIKYSLYTFKKDFLHDERYDRSSCLWNGDFPLCYFWNEEEHGYDSYNDKLAITQNYIDKNLDKIYEFPVITETSSVSERILYWDGKTDPEFTGKSFPIRGHLILAAQNAETGELISAENSYSTIETYLFSHSDYNLNGFVNLIVNTDEYGKQTLSAKIAFAFDDRPVKLTAYLIDGNCTHYVPTYDMVNRGTEGIIAQITSRFGKHGIIAYQELKNHTVDPANPFLKIYDWPEIKKINWNDQKWKDLLKDTQGSYWNNNTLGYGGWPWEPEPFLDGDYLTSHNGYILDCEDMIVCGIIIEALDNDGNPIETYTGINEGYMHDLGFFDFPQLTNPKTIVGIPAIGTDDRITIGTDGNGNFTILCNDDNCAPESYAIVNMMGQTVQAGQLSGLHREIIVANKIHSGIYIITVNSKNGSKYAQKIIINNK